jgi:hypothetical protein
MDYKNWILPKRYKCKPVLLRLGKNWILKQKWQKSPAGTRQNRRQKLGLVWRNRKKISQIIKDYFCLPFFLLLFYGYRVGNFRQKNIQRKTEYCRRNNWFVPAEFQLFRYSCKTFFFHSVTLRASILTLP